MLIRTDTTLCTILTEMEVSLHKVMPLSRVQVETQRLKLVVAHRRSCCVVASVVSRAGTVRRVGSHRRLHRDRHANVGGLLEPWD